MIQMKFKCYGTKGLETPFGPKDERCLHEFFVDCEDMKVLPPNCPDCGSSNTHRIN